MALLGALGVGLSPHLGGGVPLFVRALLYLVTGAGAIGWNALLLTWAGERVSPERSASAIALAGTSVFAGSAVFPPLFGLLAARVGFGPTWFCLAGLLLLAALNAFAAGTARTPRK